MTRWLGALKLSFDSFSAFFVEFMRQNTDYYFVRFRSKSKISPTKTEGGLLLPEESIIWLEISTSYHPFRFFDAGLWCEFHTVFVVYSSLKLNYSPKSHLAFSTEWAHIWFAFSFSSSSFNYFCCYVNSIKVECLWRKFKYKWCK